MNPSSTTNSSTSSSARGLAARAAVAALRAKTRDSPSLIASTASSVGSISGAKEALEECRQGAVTSATVAAEMEAAALQKEMQEMTMFRERLRMVESEMNVVRSEVFQTAPLESHASGSTEALSDSLDSEGGLLLAAASALLGRLAGILGDLSLGGGEKKALPAADSKVPVHKPAANSSTSCTTSSSLSSAAAARPLSWRSQLSKETGWSQLDGSILVALCHLRLQQYAPAANALLMEVLLKETTRREDAWLLRGHAFAGIGGTAGMLLAQLHFDKAISLLGHRADYLADELAARDADTDAAVAGGATETCSVPRVIKPLSVEYPGLLSHQSHQPGAEEDVDLHYAGSISTKKDAKVPSTAATEEVVFSFDSIQEELGSLACIGQGLDLFYNTKKRDATTAEASSVVTAEKDIIETLPSASHHHHHQDSSSTSSSCSHCESKHSSEGSSSATREARLLQYYKHLEQLKRKCSAAILLEEEEREASKVAQGEELQDNGGAKPLLGEMIRMASVSHSSTRACVRGNAVYREALKWRRFDSVGGWGSDDAMGKAVYGSHSFAEATILMSEGFFETAAIKFAASALLQHCAFERGEQAEEGSTVTPPSSASLQKAILQRAKENLDTIVDCRGWGSSVPLTSFSASSSSSTTMASSPLPYPHLETAENASYDGSITSLCSALFDRIFPDADAMLLGKGASETLRLGSAMPPISPAPSSLDCAIRSCLNASLCGLKLPAMQEEKGRSLTISAATAAMRLIEGALIVSSTDATSSSVSHAHSSLPSSSSSSSTASSSPSSASLSTASSSSTTKSFVWYCKALLRRATALQELAKYDLALADTSGAESILCYFEGTIVPSRTSEERLASTKLESEGDVPRLLLTGSQRHIPIETLLRYLTLAPPQYNRPTIETTALTIGETTKAIASMKLTLRNLRQKAVAAKSLGL